MVWGEVRTGLECVIRLKFRQLKDLVGLEIHGGCG